MSDRYAELVERNGLGAANRFQLEEIRDGARVLEIGCSSGYVAAELARRGCAVVGFERDPEAAALAVLHCERVIAGDIESAEDRARIDDRFDAVLLGDVLEHLVDPWSTLRYTRSLLSPGGVVIVSIPNVAAWPVRLGLLRGSFDYTETGLLDRTHLRFFTRASAHALARDAGFVIERERLAPIEQPPGLLRRVLPRATDIAVKSALRIWPGLMAQQFVMRLRPCA